MDTAHPTPRRTTLPPVNTKIIGRGGVYKKQSEAVLRELEQTKRPGRRHGR